MFLSWITFAFIVTPGYITYKRRSFNLEGKINVQWSRNLTTEGRFPINQLTCCGYFSPFVEATISQICYAWSILPGCKGPYLAFERNLLRIWYTAAFSPVPPQILVMAGGLLCPNHITYEFGKGMMPEAYRLNMNTMAVLMDSFMPSTIILSSSFRSIKATCRSLRSRYPQTYYAYVDYSGHCSKTKNHQFCASLSVQLKPAYRSITLSCFLDC